jgi:hypothetical protein
MDSVIRNAKAPIVVWEHLNIPRDNAATRSDRALSRGERAHQGGACMGVERIRRRVSLRFPTGSSPA